MDYFTRLNILIGIGYSFSAICMAGMIGVIAFALTRSVAASIIIAVVLSAILTALIVRSEGSRAERSLRSDADEA